MKENTSSHSREEFRISYPASSWDGERYSAFAVPRRPVIDAHVHCLMDQGILQSASFKETYGFTPPFCGSTEELIRVMRWSDVEHAVILTGGRGGSREQAQVLNKQIGEIVSGNSCFTGLAYVPADGTPGAVKILEEAVFTYGLEGVGEIFPVGSAEDFRYLFEAAHEMSLTVCIDNEVWTDEDVRWFRNHLSDYCNMRLVFAHMGQNNRDILRLALNFPNVYFDISIEIHYYEARVYESVKTYGSDRFLFATDFPATAWTMYDDMLRIERMEFSEKEKDDIFFQNAKKVYLSSKL